LRGAKTIGLIAGASAPEILVPKILVEDVIVASSAFGLAELTTLPEVMENGEFKLSADLND
jgi:hypothetical protein